MSQMYSRTRAKICGLTRVPDVQSAVNAGVDAIGFVFYEPSPRYVSPLTAKDLSKYIPPYVQIVGLVVNATLKEIEQLLSIVPIDVLQFHGDESPQKCQLIADRFHKRWYKAIQVKPDLDVIKEVEAFYQAGASAVLLDAWHPDLKGGTGESFDWSKFPKLNVPLILAGGLTPDNIQDAIKITQPFAVDVSGGVESSKGIKDQQLIEKFMQGVLSGSAK